MISFAPNVLRGSKSINFNATTSIYNYGALGASHNAAETTFLALIRPTGSGENAFGYVAAKVPSAAVSGLRFYVDHNAGSPQVAMGFASSTGGANPFRRASPSITYGRWTWVAGTHDGSVNASGIALYASENNTLNEYDSFASDTNGSGTLTTNSGDNFCIGNRQNSDRTFAGDIALVARWTRKLTKAELERAIREGPMSVQLGNLILCWVGGIDVSPRAITATTITAASSGRDTLYPVSTLARQYFPVSVGSGTQTVTPGGIGSLEAFGSTVVIPGAVSVVASGIATAEAFGSHTLTQGGVSVICSGIVSDEAFGTATVVPGAVSIICSGVASLEAFGDAIVSAGGSIVTASGIASAEAFGSHTLLPGAVTIACNGIASDEAFGATTVAVGAQFVSPAAIATAEAFGNHTFSVGAVTILCSGIASAEAFGVSVITGGAVSQLQPGILWALSGENRVLMPSDDRVYRLQ